MHTVLIADADRIFATALTNQLTLEYDIVATLCDGETVAEQILQQKPDILILDVILSGMDGIRVLEHVKRERADYNPIVYVVSAIASVKVVRALSELGIDYFSVKPVSPETIAENLCFLIREEKPIPATKPLRTSEQNMQAAEISNTKKIDWLLRSFGASPRLRSTKTLKDALDYCMGNPDDLFLMIKNLYQTLAKQDGITPGSVERRIRYSIGLMQQTNTPQFAELFSYRGTRYIKNSEFLIVSSDYLVHIDELPPIVPRN